MMLQLPNLKFNPEKLKNVIAAIVGRAVASIKRFVSARHNRCPLVVYVNGSGRTCSTFLKLDSFSGYDFQFNGDRCTIVNKATGDLYVATFSSTRKWCPCRSYEFSPKQNKNCKHLRMIGELKGELGIEQVIAQAEFNQYVEQQSVAECAHLRARTGLDACYCPTCKRSFESGTATYNQILSRVQEINPKDTPRGCILKRSDDWTAMEFDVYVTVMERQRGIPTPVLKNIGRIVQHPGGIHAYRQRSGIGYTFQSTREAIAYLVQIIGTSFSEIETACAQRDQLMKRKVARL